MITFLIPLKLLSINSISLCDHLADLLLSVDHDNNQQSALQIYKESLSFDSHNDEIYLKMAKIEMRNDHFDQAHTYCTNVLKNNANMDEALLVGRLLFCLFLFDLFNFLSKHVQHPVDGRYYISSSRF